MRSASNKKFLYCKRIKPSIEALFLSPKKLNIYYNSSQRKSLRNKNRHETHFVRKQFRLIAKFWTFFPGIVYPEVLERRDIVLLFFFYSPLHIQDEDIFHLPVT